MLVVVAARSWSLLWPLSCYISAVRVCRSKERRSWAWVLLLLVGCVSREEPVGLEESESLRIAEALPPVTLDTVVGEGVAPAEEQTVWTVQDAFVTDEAYAAGPPVLAQRMVYRMTFRVPANQGIPERAIPGLVAELYVDVDRDRLRARFAGTGWPVDPGSEVRLRADQPGVYVFDGDGGRSLGPGQLAHWFEGGRPRRSPGFRIKSPPAEEQVGAGPLLCRFLAEWAAAAPDALARRCGEGGSPPSFRVGLWRGERTADVTVRLPRQELRADHLSPPPPMRARSTHAFLSDEVLSRLPQERRRDLEEDRAAFVAEAGLWVTNQASNRIIVTVRGSPIGWADAHETVHFPSVRPGVYRVGAVRPFGLQAARARAMQVPGGIRLPRWIRRSEQVERRLAAERQAADERRAEAVRRALVQ